MEDTFSVAFDSEIDEVKTQEPRRLHRKYLYSGIFDGHGGKEAAIFARNHLLENIVSLEGFWSDDDHSILKAISEGFVNTHLAMAKQVRK